MGTARPAQVRCLTGRADDALGGAGANGRSGRGGCRCSARVGAAAVPGAGVRRAAGAVGFGVERDLVGLGGVTGRVRPRRALCPVCGGVAGAAARFDAAAQAVRGGGDLGGAAGGSTGRAVEPGRGAAGGAVGHVRPLVARVACKPESAALQREAAGCRQPPARSLEPMVGEPDTIFAVFQSAGPRHPDLQGASRVDGRRRRRDPRVLAGPNLESDDRMTEVQRAAGCKPHSVSRVACPSTRRSARSVLKMADSSWPCRASLLVSTLAPEEGGERR